MPNRPAPQHNQNDPKPVTLLAGTALAAVMGIDQTTPGVTNGVQIVGATPLPAGASTEATLALIKAKTDNLDVLLSTRTKPADIQSISATALPLPAGAAADATLTGGTAKAIVRGGAKGTTVAADVTSTASGVNHNGADVVLYDAAGNVIDPRSIRALTTADAVNVGQWIGSAAPTVGQKAMASSLPVALASDQSSVPATAAQGAAAAVTAGWPMKFQLPTASALLSASVSVAASGDNTLVAGVAAQTVRVFRLLLVFAGAVNIIFKDATAGTALTGAMTMTPGGSLVLDLQGDPWFTSAAAGAFVLNLSAAVQASGRVWYIQS